MPKHLVSVRVTRHGKFRKTHLAEITAPTSDEALRRLKDRCTPSGEYARKFPGATFSEFEALTVEHVAGGPFATLPIELVCE